LDRICAIFLFCPPVTIARDPDLSHRSLSLTHSSRRTGAAAGFGG